MPSANAQAEISVRFESKEEKDHYKVLIKEKYDEKFAKWAAQLIRDHFKGMSESSPLVIDLRRQIDSMAEELQRLESENLFYKRVVEANKKELTDIRARMFAKPELFSGALFDIVYSFIQDCGETTRKDILEHLEYKMNIPNLIDRLRDVEMSLVSNGVIEIKDGIIYSLLEGEV